MKIILSSGADAVARVRPGRAIFAVAALTGALALVAAQPAAAGEQSEMGAKNQVLRAQVEGLSQELQILKNMVLKNQQAVAEANAGTDTPKKMVTSGKDKVSLKISGQVSRMALYADDGNEARWFQADNDNSSTRVRFVGTSNLDENWSAGATIEVQFESNSSADVTIDQNSAVIDDNAFTERKLEIYVANKKFGKLTMGQGDTASNGAAEVDLSGTTLASKSEISTLGKELAFRASGTKGTSAGRDVGDLFNNFDGLSRDDRLRYDTATYSGFMASTSWVDGDEWDIALRYGRKFDGVEVAAAGALWEAGPTGNLSGYAASGSIKMPFGTSLTLAYSAQDRETVGRKVENFAFGKIGHQFKMNDLGKTSISFDYSKTNNQGADDNEANAYSFAAVQKINGLGAEIFGVLRQYSADIVDTETNSITVGGFGARIKF